jgi:translation initiation factor IF-2
MLTWQTEASEIMKSALSSIKLQERGVYVQASTLGSLEALLEFLKQSKIPVSKMNVCSSMAYDHHPPLCSTVESALVLCIRKTS